MDDAVRVCFGKRFGDVSAQTERIARRQPSTFEAIREGLAFDVLHHHQRRRGGIDRVEHVEDRRDVRMVERRSRARLAQQAFAAVGCRRAVLPKRFDRYRPPERRVVGEVDVTHAA